MRRHTWLLAVAAGIILAHAPAWAADDEAAQVAKQKAAAKANWKKIYGEDPSVTEETEHLLLYGPPGMTSAQLKELGTRLEAIYALSRKGLQMAKDDDVWSGKLAVYLIEDRKHYSSFLRSVIKQRPSADESGTYSFKNYQPLVVAGPPSQGKEPTMENQAALQLAEAIFSKTGGSSVPEWVRGGFARATLWEASPTMFKKERQAARALVSLGRTAKDVWEGKPNVQQATVLRASLVDYLAYGPGAKSFPKFLEGYAPDEKIQKKTTPDALKAINVKWEDLERNWKGWLARGN
jgi:hypothetical protein